MKEVRKKKILLIVIACLSFAFPVNSLALETQDEVGIGFKDVATPTVSIPVEQNNVLPLTSGYEKPYSTKSSLSALPKTGEQNSWNLQLMGIGCLLLSFWLFSYLLLDEEEDYE